MKKNILLFSFFILFISGSFAQPFVDVINGSYQTFNAKYYKRIDTLYAATNKTDNFFLNFFLPKEFKNGNALLIRLNSETINSTISPSYSYSYRLSSVSLPIGIKLVTKNKKWETIVIGVPKIASDFRDPIDAHDIQYGGIFLQQWVPNKKLKVKAGLYYNREAFGNFFVPLVAVDWKINDRIYLYGILPTNYKAEFNIIKQKLYCGLNFKSLTRSFSLSKNMNYDYVRYDEMQVKFFVDCFVYKKILLFGEIGYNLGKGPLQYKNGTENLSYFNAVYTPLKSNYLIFNVGIAYRVRLDFAKEGEDAK